MHRRKNLTEQESSLASQFAGKYLMYWPLFVVILSVLLLASYVYIRYTTPKYEAVATIIIKDEKKGNDDSKLIESLNIIGTKKIIENETEVLQSMGIMENVVKTLHLYAPVSMEGKIRDVSAYSFSPVFIEALYPDSIIEAKKIYIEYSAATGDILIDHKPAGKINTWMDTKYGTLKFILSKNYHPEKINKPLYFSLLKPKDVSKDILKSLKIVPSTKLSSIIKLSYRDEVPERSEDILNQLIYMYDKSAIDEKNNLAKTTLEFVEKRLNAVAKDLDSIEKSVQQYKSSRGATDISAEGQLYLQNVSSNDQELGKINTQLAVLDQADRAIKQNNNDNSGGLMNANVGITDPNISNLMIDLKNKELEYEKLKKTVAENNPVLISLRDQINKIKPSITENLQNQRKSLEASRSNLFAMNSKFNSVLNSIPVKERQLLEMSRDQNIKKSIYSFLLQKREESELSYVSNISNSRVLNSALASKFPVTPNKVFVMLTAIGLSIALFLLIIHIKDSISNKVLFRKDLEKMMSIPVIAEISYNKANTNILIERGKRSLLAEEFRRIRLSMHFLGVNSIRNSILVTSGIPGEGKSFIAANTAISESLTGKKVLLIDADLHDPSQGKYFGFASDHPGLSDYLQKNIEPNEIIQKIKGYEQLYFIPAGKILESPSEYLINGKINQLIDFGKKQFDFVVIDTAPLQLITDGYLLSALCDFTIYVVRHNYTPKIILKRLDENLEVNPLKNPSVIFNGVKTRGFFKNNYGYGYNYVYGGKYAQEADSKARKKSFVKA